MKTVIEGWKRVTTGELGWGLSYVVFVVAVSCQLPCRDTCSGSKQRMRKFVRRYPKKWWHILLLCCTNCWCHLHLFAVQSPPQLRQLVAFRWWQSRILSSVLEHQAHPMNQWQSVPFAAPTTTAIYNCVLYGRRLNCQQEDTFCLVYSAVEYRILSWCQLQEDKDLLLLPMSNAHALSLASGML